MLPKKSKNDSGFTLVELMITIAIIGILAAVAIPNYVGYQERAKLRRLGANLKTLSDGFYTYFVTNGCYPPDSHQDGTYNLKPGYGTEGYLPIETWTATPDWGGFFNWEGPDNYPYAGISLHGTSASQSQMVRMDAMIDDGDLTSGTFQKTSNGRYTYIVDATPESACN